MSRHREFEGSPSPDDKKRKMGTSPKGKGVKTRKTPPVAGSQKTSESLASPEDVSARIFGKLRLLPDFRRRKKWRDIGDEEGFQVLVFHILGERRRDLHLCALRLTDDGRIIGKIRKEHLDIAVPESFPQFVGLCFIDFAIDMICDCAERNGFTLEERAFLLNALPRFPDSEAIFD